MFRYKYFVFISLVFFISIFSGCTKDDKNDKSLIGTKKSERKTPGSAGYLYFVGMIGEKPGLYKYNFSTKEYERFWFNKSERVIQLSYSPGGNYAFFITVENISKVGIFSYLTNVRLYLLTTKTSEVFFLKNIGSGFQVFTSWETGNIFKIILNSPDKGVVTYVNQTTAYYNTFGKELMEQTKTYDITKDGYPNPVKTKSINISPNGKYRLFSVDSLTNSIYLQEIHSGKNMLISSSNQRLKQTVWSKDGSVVSFSTVNFSPQDSADSKSKEVSNFFIYSLLENKIIAKLHAGESDNFILINNFLIFDSKQNNNSSIRIFDIRTKRDFDNIIIKGGCGLQAISQIQDYGA